MAKAFIKVNTLPEARTYTSFDRSSESYMAMVIEEEMRADWKEAMRAKKLNLDVIERSNIERIEKETGRKLSFVYLLEKKQAVNA